MDAKSFVFYLSDHGENLFDDSKNLSMHGSSTPTKYEYHIPYFIWTSERYRQTSKEKYESLHSNKDKKASSTSTFYTLLDMANIQYKDSSKELIHSLSNSGYQEPKERKLITGSKKIITIE